MRLRRQTYINQEESFRGECVYDFHPFPKLRSSTMAAGHTRRACCRASVFPGQVGPHHSGAITSLSSRSPSDPEQGHELIVLLRGVGAV